MRRYRDRNILRGIIPYILLLLVLYSCESDSIKPGIFKPSDFNSYRLLLSDSVIRKMNALRTDALNKSDFTKAKVWFGAHVISNDDTIKAKVRLKGDQYDHYDSEQYSIRLKYKEDTVTKRVVSLQHPKTRRYISEWIFHQLLKQEGIPYLSFDFVAVTINGKLKGLYAAEEHLSNTGVENKWNKPHGPILGFDDTNYWPEGINGTDKIFDTECYKTAELKCFNFKGAEKESALYQKALLQLQNYRKGELTPKQVFDLDLMAKYYAICDLASGIHALRWLNCRYYFNPTTNLFEPVGFDSNASRINTIAPNNKRLNTAHHGRIFDDPSFKTSYAVYLKKYSKAAFLDDFFLKHNAQIDLFNSAFRETYQIDCEARAEFAYINQWVILWNLLVSI